MTETISVETEKEQQLIEVLHKASELVQDLPENLQPAAFNKVFDFLVGGSIVSPQVKNSTSPIFSTNNGAVSSTLPANLTVGEFLKKVAVDSHNARFVAIAYYLLHTGKATQFNIADVLEIYGKLREPKPKNPADVINQCIRKTHITDASTTSEKGKSWCITPSGEEFVEELMAMAANPPKASK